MQWLGSVPQAMLLTGSEGSNRQLYRQGHGIYVRSPPDGVSRHSFFNFQHVYAFPDSWWKKVKGAGDQGPGPRQFPIPYDPGTFPDGPKWLVAQQELTSVLKLIHPTANLIHSLLAGSESARRRKGREGIVKENTTCGEA